MPSSTSSSDPSRSSPELGRALMQPGKPGDDPRIGEGPIERPLPRLALGHAALVALIAFVAGVLAWEAHWRSFGAEPGYSNSDGQWVIQRRRIDAGEADALVLLGTSRMLFDLDLGTWESLAGERPIQLALEGTSPMPFLEDLAHDEDFRGTLLVDATPDLFFSGYAMRERVLSLYQRQSPSQRWGERLAMLIEPRFGFLDPDFRLFTVVARQAWPAREGVNRRLKVRKLSVHEADRNSHMWSKVEDDSDYQALAQRVWAEMLDRPPPPDFDTPEEVAGVIGKQIDRASAAVKTLQARGVEVIFIRPPSNGPYYAFEQQVFPREATWDLLLQRSGVPGIHFEDHPEMQGLSLPEWSHLSAADARRYTAALYGVWSDMTTRQQRP